MHHLNYSLESLENMIPWEREIYLSKAMKAVEEKNKEIERMKQG